MHRTRSRHHIWIEAILFLLLPALAMAASELLFSPVPVFSWSATVEAPAPRPPVRSAVYRAPASDMPRSTAEGPGGNTVLLPPDRP